MAAPSPHQAYLRQQYAAPQQQRPPQASAPSQHSSTANVYGGGAAAPPAPGRAPEAYYMAAGAGGGGGGAAAARAGPAIKTWSDEEGVTLGKHGPSCCSKFRFTIWLVTVVLLVCAAVGLSVTMAIVMDNRNSSSGGGGSAPPPPPPPVDPDGGGGGDGSGGDGNTGPLPAPTEEPAWVPQGQRLIWYDDFDGTTLDPNKWSYDLGTGDWGWGNNEMQTYTDSPDNVRVADGNLHITALRDGNSYTSGRINTKAHASFFPGMQLSDGTTFSSIHVEFRVQLPTPGQGLWPAAWLFPTELKYGKWAASGEIDVMESVNDFKKITQGLHYGGADPQNQKRMVRSQQGDKKPYSDGFHTVALDWQAAKIQLSVDGKVAGTFVPRDVDPENGWWTEAAGAPPNAPFNDPFYIILNLAVGGLWPDPPDATTPFPATYTVDYVRVWGKPA